MRFASRDPPELRTAGTWRMVGMTLCEVDGRPVPGWVEVWEAAEDRRPAAPPASRRTASWSSFAA